MHCCLTEETDLTRERRSKIGSDKEICEEAHSSSSLQARGLIESWDKLAETLRRIPPPKYSEWISLFTGNFFLICLFSAMYFTGIEQSDDE